MKIGFLSGILITLLLGLVVLAIMWPFVAIAQWATNRGRKKCLHCQIYILKHALRCSKCGKAQY